MRLVPTLAATSTSTSEDYFAGASHIGHQGLAQGVLGPMQDDEALLLFALVQASQVRRVLEVGGLGGFSALTLAQAMRRKPHAIVYSVDLHATPRRHPRHRSIRKDAAQLQPADVGGAPLDLIFLDCHVYNATKATLTRLLRLGMLAHDGFIVRPTSTSTTTSRADAQCTHPSRSV